MIITYKQQFPTHIPHSSLISCDEIIHFNLIDDISQNGRVHISFIFYTNGTP